MQTVRAVAEAPAWGKLQLVESHRRGKAWNAVSHLACRRNYILTIILAGSAAEVERCVEVLSVSTRVLASSDGGSTSSGRNLVLIKGQGRGQGLVKMEDDGRLLFADPDKETEGGLFGYLITANIILRVLLFQSVLFAETITRTGVLSSVHLKVKITFVAISGQTPRPMISQCLEW